MATTKIDFEECAYFSHYINIIFICLVFFMGISCFTIPSFELIEIAQCLIVGRDTK